jgi:hypothetical protein
MVPVTPTIPPFPGTIIDVVIFGWCPRLEEVKGEVNANNQDSDDAVRRNLTRRGARHIWAESDATVDDGQSNHDAAHPNMRIRPAAAFLDPLVLGMMEMAQCCLDEQHANKDDAKILVEAGKILF